MADLTTFRVGGPARAFVAATTSEELVDAVRASDEAGEPVLVVGGGSNLLVSDEGVPGTVVHVRTKGIEDTLLDDTVRVDAAAGEWWDELVARSVESGWSGLEALSGIPGQVGATPIQNVGAYGSEVREVIESIEILDRRTGRVGRLTADECGFGYRTSALKRDPDHWLVLGVRFVLRRDGRSAPVRYAELARTLGVQVGDQAPLADVRAAVLGLRSGKGMVLDAADHDTWSAGSFFTNPLLDPDVADRLPAEAPRFPQPDGRVKTSAAWLISHSGFERGHRIAADAPAGLSTKHVLALTNRGGASARDILALAREVRAGVQTQYGITLENEPVLVGCSL